jgi:ABC-type Zn uptake system ZnuABC Zn-binding protein ZnuA
MKKLHFRIKLTAFLVLMFFINGCATRQDRDPSHPLKVVATTGLIADAIQQIAQGAVEVHTLMGPC